MARSRQILLLVDRLQDILEEYGCDACTDNGSQNVDPEPSAYGIGKGSIAPSSKVGHQSGTEVAGGIKAALRNGCDEEDNAAHGETDEQWLHVGRWTPHVAVLCKCEDEQYQKKRAEPLGKHSQREIDR